MNQTASNRNYFVRGGGARFSNLGDSCRISSAHAGIARPGAAGDRRLDAGARARSDELALEFRNGAYHLQGKHALRSRHVEPRVTPWALVFMLEAYAEAPESNDFACGNLKSDVLKERLESRLQKSK